MRLAAVFSLLIVAGLVSACAVERPFRDPQTCLKTYERLDRAERIYGTLQFNPASDTYMHAPTYAREIQNTVTRGCITREKDLIGLDDLAGSLADFTIENDDRSVRPTTAVHVGVVDGFWTSGRAKEFFRGLGYGVRTTGVMGLGRRMYIGPFRTLGAAEQAVEIARQAGFIAPYVSRSKF